MRTKSCFHAFFFTSLILLTAFALGSMFPFGMGTVSWCDMNQQGIPLLCDFKDILAGESGFFLNMKNASGMNFYGVFFFFLASPFSFLVAFVDKADIPFLINILVVLKLSIASATAAYFFEKCFSKLSKGMQICLGTAYGICGYGMMFFQNIMWLDIMYLLPLLMLGIFNLIKKDKPLLLVLSLSGCIVMNYYISFMVFLFVIFFFGIFAFYFKNADKKIYFNLGCCGLISLLATAVVWLPSYLQYSASARRDNIIENLQNSNFFAPKDTTLPIMLCSGIVFAVLLLLIPRLSSENKVTRFFLLVFFALFLPLLIEPVNLIWHTGSYMAFPARYGFITVFLGLIVCAIEFSKIEFPQSNSKKHVIALIALIFITAPFMIWYTDVNIYTLARYVDSLWGDEKSLEGLFILCTIAVISYFFIIYAAKKRVVTRRVFSALLCTVIAIEGICSTEIYMNSAHSKLDLNNYRNFLSLNENTENDKFYRVNTERKFIDANMTGAAGFNSISHYTSLNNKDTMKAAKQFGYSGYWMETGNWGGSILSDALLSVGYTAHKMLDSYYLEKNLYYLGLGIKAYDEIPKKLADGNRLEELGEAFSALTGCENPVERYAHTSTKNCDYIYDNDKYIISPHGNTGKLNYTIFVSGNQTLYFDCYNGFSNNLTEPINKSFAISVNGKNISNSYPSQNYNGLLNLGSFENQQVNITITAFKNVECFSFGVFGVNEFIVDSAVRNTDTLNLTADKNSITGKVDSAGKYFLSIPYDKNYKITLNGEKINYTRALTGFTAIELNETGLLSITYTPPGFTAGLIISVIGIIVLMLFIIFNKKQIPLPQWCYSWIFGIFIIVFLTALTLVYIMPIIINITN